MTSLSPTQKAIILLAHGSRDERWKAPFESLLQQAKAQHPEDTVLLAYMEMTTPTLETALNEAISQHGCTRVEVLPLFMASGGHLRHDVPNLIEQGQQHFPGVSITMASPIGEHPLVQQAMLGIIDTLLSSTEPQD